MPVLSCPNCSRGCLRYKREEEILRCDGCGEEFSELPEDIFHRSLDMDILRVFEDHGVDIKKIEYDLDSYSSPGDKVKWIITGEHEMQSLEEGDLPE